MPVSQNFKYFVKMVGKQKEKKPKVKKVETDNAETGADKISKMFYGWMKKKRPQIIISLGSEQYEIKGLICEGSFGKVFTALNLHTRLVAAAKLEQANSSCPQLQIEYKIYEKLGCDRPGFLKVYHYGLCDKAIFNVLIMELLGPDLDDLFITCQNIFSKKTVLMIALQTLELIRHVHKKRIIYRDIKPENFCIGHKYKSKEKLIYIIDFGLSKILDAKVSVSPQDEAIADYMIGTARYMSVNSHFACEQSQRDDLESLGYMYVYFLKGRLPWMGLSKNNTVADQYKDIANMKARMSPNELIPECTPLAQYLQYVRRLKYMENPNYDYLIELIRKELQKSGEVNDAVFDWTPIMNQRYLNKALSVDNDD